jgi:pheromone shutdown protein TraB
VGAGHVPGISERIKEEQDLNEITQIPPGSIWPKILKWGIPALIVGLIAFGFTQSAEQGMQNIYIWVLVNGILSSLGAAVAFAHPLTVLSAFVAAPLTSLNPFMAAGFVAGLVQAVLAKPTVADFQRLPVDIETVKGFWKNKVVKIFMVVLMANVGSILGTWIAGFWLAGRNF